jgi:hypothetical protein
MKLISASAFAASRFMTGVCSTALAWRGPVAFVLR